jgi:hypothetical protein
MEVNEFINQIKMIEYKSFSSIIEVYFSNKIKFVIEVRFHKFLSSD